ncbi:MAG: ParA family protein [Deltaproteobacteria bacterium]|nr:ParA family protein [Deltaproteobacteria bacterium]
MKWPKSMNDRNQYRPFRIITAFWQIMQMAAEQVGADIIFVDIGPNLGAINRSVLIASDYVAIPLGADLFSLQGLKNLGPTLRNWRGQWQKRLENWPSPEFPLPEGRMTPIGYIVQQHSVRLDKPVKAYDKWINRMPAVYHEHLLGGRTDARMPTEDEECLGTLKHYRSLIPMAQEARKPVFELTAADGAIGSHAKAVTEAHDDFKRLAEKPLEKMSSCSTKTRSVTVSRTP